MEYLKIWTSFAEIIEPLNDSERGRLFTAMLIYADCGELPDIKGNERYVWPVAKQAIDRARAESDKLTANGSKGGRPKTKDNQEKPTETKENQDEPNESHKDNIKKRKDKDKEKENVVGVPPIPPTRETDFGLVEADPIILTVQRHLTELTETHYQELQDYRETLGDDLVLKAINDTVANGVHAWAYVRAILQGFIRDGIKTVADAEQRDERRRQNKSSGGKEMRDQSYTQREYTDAELNGFAADLIKEAEAYA